MLMTKTNRRTCLQGSYRTDSGEFLSEYDFNLLFAYYPMGLNFIRGFVDRTSSGVFKLVEGYLFHARV